MSRKTIGNKYEYELSNRLGQGAFAEVYKGRNKLTGEAVAIKVIKRSILARYGEDMLKQIHMEVEVLQQLVQQMKHQVCPFINKIFECLETTNHIYIVLELCNEGTLLQQIQKRQKSHTKYSESEAVMILFQLTHALAFLANNKTAHRDIKPDNVFMSDGMCKLGDFGFAGQKQMYQTHLGTYPYMAPEFFNSTSYDGAVDVWALGCMFHEILFGEIYFMGKTQYEVSMKIMNKAYQIGDNLTCSNEIRDLLPRMVEKDKTKRITASQMLEHPLFNQVKVSPQYLKIMADETLYMQKYFGTHQVLSTQESIQSQEESLIDQQSALTKQIDAITLPHEQAVVDIDVQLYQYMQNIINGINSMRNAVFFFVQLCEWLQKQYLNECRYEIFYMLKQSLVQMGKLKELLDEQATQFDSVELRHINAECWRCYYSNHDGKQAHNHIDRYTKQREDITHERAVLLKSYIDYYNYINNHTQLNHSEHLLNLQTMTNLNLQDFIPQQLYAPQLHSTITHFAQLLPTCQDPQQKLSLQKLILWLYLAARCDQVFEGQLVDIGAFLDAMQHDDVKGMKSAITIPQ